MSRSNTILYLSRDDVERLRIPVDRVILAVENAFREKAAGRTEMPPKPGIHPKENAFIHAMPAYMPGIQAAGVKWVSGYPENTKRGLPYISGLLILNDPETGFPISIMDCTWITAKRTGAVTAVAAKHFAREDSKVLGIVGCGVQGRSNLEALLTVSKKIERIKAYDTIEENLKKYVKEESVKYGIKISAEGSAKKALEGSDIVVTSGPILRQPHPIIERSWFKNGGLACPLDFDSYWKPEAMFSMDKFFVDDIQQLWYYKRQGYFSQLPNVYAELGDVVAGEKSGRVNKNERIMSMNLGLAIEDIATAKLVFDKANEAGIGVRLPF
jgi:ornithine cyclodeaminase/alanine dehydrogenase-like protein (mu-crystallin family)